MTLYVVASEYVTARLRRHEGASATPRGSGYGVTSSFGFFLRPETGLYGQLARPWSLTSPLLRQGGLNMLHIGLLHVNFYLSRLQPLGTTPTPSDWTSSVRDVSVVSGGVLSLTSSLKA
jgi:hypothetical protein